MILSTQFASSGAFDEGLSTFYCDSNYWQFVHEQETLYNSGTNKSKKEGSVKSTIVLFNHCHIKGVIETAYHLRNQLEEGSKTLKDYIRPILLIIAPPLIGENETALYTLKQQLIKTGIPQEEIKLKTNAIDELEGIVLTCKSCKVRYILTVHNLHKSWKCPFAYIIASLADLKSIYDLSPVLYTALHKDLSTNYPVPFNTVCLLTACSKFEELKTLFQQNIQTDTFSPVHHFKFKDAFLELLKCQSVFEVLKMASKNRLEGIQLSNTIPDNRVINEIKRLCNASSNYH